MSAIDTIVVKNVESMNTYDLVQFCHTVVQAKGTLTPVLLEQIAKQFKQNCQAESGHTLSLMLYSYLKLATVQDIQFIQFILLQVFMTRVNLDLESCIKMVGSLN